ncbi:hypothetical protein Adt_26877 [Abeliophyllum distichum]|uniref:Uncharacterized protein n=1 Tax=Abeliophyllum distichum TaxID=126358 RepID=A0ABD1RTA1_9LAMI
MDQIQGRNNEYFRPSALDGRTLFFNYCLHFPITRQLLRNYFTEQFGDNVVENVFFGRRSGMIAGYGNITFSTSVLPHAIMGEEVESRMFICNTWLRFKKFK